MTLQTSWTRNETEFKRVSERLEDFRMRDFTAIKRYVMPVVFPKSYSRRLPADLPLIQAYSRELGGHWYAETPVRTFKGVNEAQAAGLAALYKKLKVDVVMKTAIEQCMVHHTVILALIPVPGSTEWTLQTFCPFEAEVDPNPVDSQNIHRAKEIRLRVPVTTDYRQVVYGELVLREDKKAFYRGKAQVGVFNGDQTWTGKAYPLCVMRLSGTRKGDFFCPIPTDLYDAQVSVSVGFSDMVHVARHNSHGQRTAYGMKGSQVLEWEFGPDTIVTPGGTPEDTKFEVLQTHVTLQPYMDSVENYVKLLVRFNGLNPDIFVRGALTAEAKKLEQNDRERTANDAKHVVLEAEQSLFEAIKSAVNWGFGWPMGIPETATVECEHKPPMLPENVLQAAQANRLQYEDGTKSPLDYIAESLGKSREEAAKIWRRNKEEYAADKNENKPKIGDRPGNNAEFRREDNPGEGQGA